MRKRNLRIHRPFHIRHTTEPIPTFELAEESPRTDHAKSYLASLHEEPQAEESKTSSSFSFDLSLAEWKSKAKLMETVPISSIYKTKNVCLYSEQPEVIMERRKESALALCKTRELTTHVSLLKPRSKKIFLNFNKSTFHNKLNPSLLPRDKKWVKPILYSLEEEQPSQNHKSKLKRQFKLQSPSIRSATQSGQKIEAFNRTGEERITLNEFKTLHGIHCFRNKFQLILNRRSINQGAFKLFSYSPIKAESFLTISNHRLT